MTVTRSLVFGTLASDLLSSQQFIRSAPAQEFVRDVVLVQQSVDPYRQLSRAKEIVAEGKSLALDAAERSRLVVQLP